jgi:cbb3-type cytochrome oxidase subunit 3
MTIIWVTIGIAAVIVWALTIVDIVRRHLGAKTTTAWLLIVLILPFLGALLYWVLRKPDPGDLDRAEEAQRSLREEARRRSFDSTSL